MSDETTRLRRRAEEDNYRVRSKLLYTAATIESDPDLRLALFAQSERVGMRAIEREMVRKLEIIQSLEIPSQA